MLLHVPHASRIIPPEVRADLLPTDVALAAELDEATDTATDEIAATALRHTGLRPTTVVNTASRLVIDPERFADAEEPAGVYGRGAVYTRTCTGTPLRAEPYPHAEHLLDGYFRPYTDAVTAAVEERLRVCGRAVIIDPHSYPEKPSGFEDPAAAPPAVYRHRPGPHPRLAGRRHPWRIRVPGRGRPDRREHAVWRVLCTAAYYGRDARVVSVMIELRRDLYLIDPRTPDAERVERLGRALAALIDTATARAVEV
ncbi:N-formylglutamate amidohydrolase [Rhodococcus sp. SMB37]|uniref:N-formylglutamate amidohydrolase n=1 Tax=Rhodococcus sp. SMB37 TaxID=2512213 RepID=UPI0010D79FE5|nr:N-formylglutamate amidohydrolase [Rhodococcus sp. SMB37]TCN53531.1 N-formylglutamate amidohydrolase [Rhodococcus sp. SMB37]